MTGDLHRNQKSEGDQQEQPAGSNPAAFVRGYRVAIHDAIRALQGEAVAWRRLGRMLGVKDEGETE